MASRTRKPRRRAPEPSVTFHSFDLRCWRGRAGRMPNPHVHADIEWNFVTKGSITYFLAGRFHTLGPGRLGVFWAGVPHRLMDSPRDVEMAWVTLPLAWFMQWGLDESFVRRLLRGELIVEPNPEMSSADDATLTRWSADCLEKRGDSRRIMAIEVEARMRRLAQTVGRHSRSRVSSDIDASGGQVERLARYLGQHYDDSDLSIGRIAEAVGLHPNYAMNLFKRGCGMSLWEYLTRLRVSHAQRLLLTTDWKVQRIALESGFGSASRFYESFGRIGGRSPREYRRSVKA